MWKIFFWHGQNEELAKLIDGFCERDELNQFSYQGSLDNFADLYQRKFIVDYKRRLISITEYSGFGQR